MAGLARLLLVSLSFSCAVAGPCPWEDGSLLRWSDQDTWDSGLLPEDGDSLEIRKGILFDVVSPKLRKVKCNLQSLPTLSLSSASRLSSTTAAAWCSPRTRRRGWRRTTSSSRRTAPWSSAGRAAASRPRQRSCWPGSWAWTPAWATTPRQISTRVPQFWHQYCQSITITVL